MPSASYKTRLTTVMAGVALASTLIVSGASAQQAYQDLRTPDARDAGELASTPKTPERTYSDLRTPDAIDASEGYRPTLEEQPGAGESYSPSGFDWLSAAIGAAAAGLLLILMATLAGSAKLRQRVKPRSA